MSSSLRHDELRDGAVRSGGFPAVSADGIMGCMGVAACRDDEMCERAPLVRVRARMQVMRAFGGSEAE